MIHTAKEVSQWVNFGHFPEEEKLPAYLTEDCISLDVFGVVEDTLDKVKDKKLIAEKIKMILDGVK